MESLTKFDFFDPYDPPVKGTKGWGHELWLVNMSDYCAKILQMDSGKRMSWHYHRLRTETFFILEGHCRLIIGPNDSLETATHLELRTGDKAHIPVGTRHQLIALTDSKILEVSTPHSESDSYRIQKGD